LEAERMFEESNAMFERMSARIERIPSMFKDDEDTCNKLGDDDSCNANDACSWCDAAAVKSACHSIENARRLPTAVFKCSKVDEELEDEEDDEDDKPKTLFGQWLHNMRLRHGDRHGDREEGREHHGKKGHGDKHHGGKKHGGKHHGGKHHGDKHQRDERPPMEMEEDEAFYGRPRVQADHEGPRGGHHERHGDHGKEHGQHHKKSHGSCCIFMKIISAALIGGHFYSIRCLNQEQMKVEKIVGKKEDKKDKKVCGFQQQSVYFATQPVQQPVQQPVLVEYSPVIQNTSRSDSSVEEDKEMGMTYAPNPTGIQTNINQMV
jgi:hypothetical protein